MTDQDKPGVARSHRRLLRDTNAAALIEFAVALPLLVVLVIGIFDFGGAFNLKQELNNAAREGARFGASEPSNDILGGGTPPSVDAIRYVVDSYLLAARLNDCGLGTMSPPGSTSGPMTWTYTATNCTPNLILTITRPCVSPKCPDVPGAQNVYMPDTYVQISYPYIWHFNNVIQLLVPGANYTLTNIITDATAANMD
ncbi:MAG TPA: TadE/TadG family type IV pilus assembly protein [Terriglobales bacterium]|nr:TadE/TadG family type IV pilus assembly protein [Terriglobales bacterium]